MQVNSAIKYMIESKGISTRAVSDRLGRAPSYISVVSRPDRSPALATVADVADVLGYDIAVVDRETGETVGTIEPPRRSGSEQVAADRS